MGLHLVPDKARAIWNEQEIRVLVLLSLLLQILLIFLAPLRKRCTSKLFSLALWSFYLGADYIATLALGYILSTQFDNNYNPQPNSDGELIAFWSPFMLLHLGGPDTITSFSQEDNDLWLRHLLGLIVQVSVAFLILLFSSFSSRLLMASFVLVFVAGLIKFAERTWALRLASKKNVKGTLDSLREPEEHEVNKSEQVAEPLPQSPLLYSEHMFNKPKIVAVPLPQASLLNSEDMFNKPEIVAEPLPQSSLPNSEHMFNKPEIVAEPLPQSSLPNSKHMFNKPEIVAEPLPQSYLPNSEPLPEPLLISRAYYFFVKLTRPELLGRPVRDDLDVIKICTFPFIQICHTVHAFRMVEIELSFLHGIRHTKASFLRSLNGVAWRCLTLLLVVAALLLFQLSEKQAFKKSNLVITYTLVLAGVVLEMVSVLFLICSDWTISFLEERDFRRIARAISEVTHCIFRKPKPQWFNTMAQYSLISKFLRTNNPSFMRRVMGLLKLEEAWDKFWYVNHVRVPNELKHMIVDTLKSYDMRPTIDVAFRRQLRSQENFWLRHFDYRLDVENLSHIFYWSIATQICYNTTSVKEKNIDGVKTYRMVGHQLSNYMMDILAPGLKNDIESFYNNVKSFFDRKEQPREADVWTELFARFQKGDRSFENPLYTALTIQDVLNKLGAKLRWQLICFFWVDVLIVETYKLDMDDIWESEYLNEGGELIFNVWVLIGHYKALRSGIKV